MAKAEEIDPALIPPRVLIDTGVWIRALGQRDSEKDSDVPICKAFARACIDARREVLLAAPTVAEIARDAGEPPPHVRGILDVPFNRGAAEILGMKMPMATMRELKNETGISLFYWKYDALIVACGLEWGADVLVTLEKRKLPRLARASGLRCASPRDFASKQTTLDLE